MRSKTGMPQGYGTTSRKSLGERTIHESMEVTMALTDHEKDLLLASLKHYITIEARSKVMAELPIAYNHWVGQDVMFVARNNEPKDRKTFAVEAQREWIRHCGGDEAGYIAHYAGQYSAEMATSIYRADAANLVALERIAGLI